MAVNIPSIEAIFSEALGIPSAEARAAYLDCACAGDPELRRQVESLMDAHDRVGRFLASPTVSFEHAAAEPVGSTVGPYKLMEQIGEGGMGVVYVAEQSHPVRRKVALKIIKPGMDTKQVVARFEAERQALAMMDHPNIAKVYDAGATESSRPYFVMELVRGIPITDYCDREQLAIPERLDLFVLVCRAVQHAHQKGMIHRDLKPSNILVTVIDGAAVPKVIDFGVAKATGAALTDRTIYTTFHQLVGTPLYMSPEQAGLSGMDIDTRSDIYGLGVLLYELLTGTTPFDQETFRQAAVDEMRRIIREEEPPKPSTRLSSLGATRAAVSANRHADARHLERDVRGELDWIVMKALEKDRRRRYETANDFAADVMRYLTDKPVEACPPSPMYRFGKFARRNRGALITSGIVAATLIAATILSTWQAVVAVRARRDTSKALVTARQAVDEMYTQVAEKWLAQQPKLTQVQRDFLEKALAFYEQFAVERGDDPDARFESARARLRVGAIQRKLGKLDESGTTFRQSLEQLEDLAARYPNRREYLSELAAYSVDFGGQHVQLGRLGEAEPLLKRSVTIMDTLVAQHPTNREDRSRLASSLRALGSFYERQDRNQEAEPLLRRGRDLFGKLRSEGLLEPPFRSMLSTCETDLGLVYMHTARLPEAEKAVRRAVEELESLLADEPANPSYRNVLTVTLRNLATIQFGTGRREDAFANERRSVDLLEALVNESPDVLEFRQQLAECLPNLLRLADAERQEEAGRIAHRCVELGEKLVHDHPAVSEYRNPLAFSLTYLADLHSSSPNARFHDPALALRLARKAVELRPENSLALQSLAWAQYRVGDWKGCVETLDKTEAPRYGSFFGAMANWQLDNKNLARAEYDRGDKTLKGHEERCKEAEKRFVFTYPPIALLRRVQAEAAALLGVRPARGEVKSEPVPGSKGPPS